MTWKQANLSYRGAARLLELDGPAHVVALSGGKDSTAMALALRERHPELQLTFFCSPTGDELPDMVDHMARLEQLLGQDIVRVTNQSLGGWIGHFDALPNWRTRWCTRILKIEPCLAFLRWLQIATEAKPILYVGLRADEEERQGIYSEQVDTRFPLREWGWDYGQVVRYLAKRGVTVPRRTDCARCYGQRLSEWYALWLDHRSLYDDAARQEEATGHTFRSPQRDSWPTSLADLAAAFASGRRPAGFNPTMSLFAGVEPQQGGCRVCRL